MGRPPKKRGDPSRNTMLRKWSHNGPTVFDSRANYMGEDLSDLYVVPVSRTRDSGCLDRSNFAVALDMLGGESDTVQVHNFGHWACGWYELILVAGDSPAYSIAEKIAEKIADYPVLNEERLSDLEWSEAAETWEDMTVRDRADAIIRTQCGSSIFAARRAALPDDDNGALMQYLVSD